MNRTDNAISFRVNVYEYPTDDDYNAMPTLVGWFDWHKATRWTDADYNGNGSGGVGRGEAVLRTAKGRWVLEHWSRWKNEDNTYRYISDEKAKDWLLRHSEDDAVTEHFGEIEEERGPGRPEIGSPVQVRLGTDLLEQVDTWAAKHGVTRAEAIRQLVTSAL